MTAAERVAARTDLHDFERALGGGLAVDAYAERDARPTSNGDRLDMAALTAPPKPIDPATLAALMAPAKQLTLL